MGLLNEMKQYFIHENTDFIDDEEAVTDFSDLADRDIDNDGEVDDSDRYLHKRLGTIAKMDESVMSDVHQMIQDAESVEDFVNSFFAKYGNKIKRNSATEKWVMSLYDESLAEMNTTSATPGYDTPNAFGDADDDTVEADGWKKIPKTNKIFKPMEGTSTFKKLMANMYNIGNGQPSINEAVKYDIEAAIKDIREFNRGNIDLEQLATSIVKNLGFKPTGNNVDNVMDHLGASTDRGGQIPEDPAMVKELYPLLEAVSYRDYKKDPTSTPVQKVNKGIAEVNRMLSEMEKIVNNNLRLKQEAGVDSSHFWKTTGTRFAKINERMTRISNRLKELSK
jgi:hypothetical protein